MDFQNILLEKKDGAAKIIINKPPLNILNIETLEEMNQALRQLRTDDEVKVVVITATGTKAFSAGVEVADHTINGLLLKSMPAKGQRSAEFSIEFFFQAELESGRFLPHRFHGQWE